MGFPCRVSLEDAREGESLLGPLFGNGMVDVDNARLWTVVDDAGRPVGQAAGRRHRHDLP